MPVALWSRAVSRPCCSPLCTRIRPACSPPPLLVTSVAPLLRRSLARHPTCAACPQDAALGHVVLLPLLPVPRPSPQSGISRQDAWPAVCVCTRTVSRRWRSHDICSHGKRGGIRRVYACGRGRLDSFHKRPTSAGDLCV